MKMHELLRQSLLPSELVAPPSPARWTDLLERWTEALHDLPRLPAEPELAQRFQSLVDHLTHGVVFEDERRHVVLANTAFCSLFGLPIGPEALLGTDCAAMADQAKQAFCDPDGFVERITELLAAQQPAHADTLELVDGRILERDYVPIFVDRTYRGHLWSYRDVTAQRQAEVRLREAQKAAEAATEAKDSFLAHMSHELRTPLTVVLGAAQLLASTEPTEEQREYVEAITKSGKVLLGLIDDVLDYSKMQAGTFDVVKKRFDLWDALEDAVETQRNRADGKGLDYGMVVADEVPRFVESDPLRLKQLVMNLASNAVKYTPDGTVEILVSTPAEGRLRVEVRDTGEGIPDDVLPQLFRPFTRHLAKHVQGTGLGLAIAQQIAGRLGGELGGSSVVGEGSRFWFEVDVVPAEASDEHDRMTGAIDLQPQTQRASRPGHVLVAEDNAFTQTILTRILERAGHQVTVVGDGASCIEAVESHRYDVLLVDGEMPVVDGYVAAARIRELGEHGRALPIVAVTANAAANARETCLAAGMDDYLRKPFVVADVLEVVARWLPDEQPSPTQRPPAAPRGREAPPIDPARLEELAGGDEAFRRELVTMFIEDAQERLDELSATAGSEDRARRLIHIIKGAAGNIGARSMESIARDLERATRLDEGRVHRTVAALRAELARVESLA